jgi:DHA1 family bicyclomycin/chloramphenicol resistance-like MFS transporter
LEYSQRTKNFFILILGALTALSPFSIDMYLPAFPKIAEAFSSTTAQVSLSLSSYFIGLSVGQLFYGPLLDRFGRKKPLYFGLVIYILATLGCLASNSIETLVALRFLQAIGGCAANVAAFAMVRDLFSVKESSKVFSLLVLILGVSPLLAPTVGGFVTMALGWQWVFLVLAGIAVLLLVASFFFLPESSAADHGVQLKIKPIFKNFAAVFKEPQFYTYTLSGSLAFAGLFVYVTSSPIIYMEIFKITPEVYSWFFAALSVGFIGSSQINILLIRHFSNEAIFKTALTGQVLVTIAFLLGALNGWYGVAGTTILIFLFLCCVGLTNPNGAALAMAPFSKNAGSASALLGFLQMGVGALASTSVGIFHSNSTLPFTMILATSSLLAWIILTVGLRRITQKIAVTNSDGSVVAH